MVKISDRNKNQYSYYCDMCGKKVSYKDDNLFQLHAKTKPNKSKKFCELCDKCFKKVRIAIMRERKRNKEG